MDEGIGFRNRSCAVGTRIPFPFHLKSEVQPTATLTFSKGHARAGCRCLTVRLPESQNGGRTDPIYMSFTMNAHTTFIDFLCIRGAHGASRQGKRDMTARHDRMCRQTWDRFAALRTSLRYSRVSRCTARFRTTTTQTPSEETLEETMIRAAGGFIAHQALGRAAAAAATTIESAPWRRGALPLKMMMSSAAAPGEAAVERSVDPTRETNSRPHLSAWVTPPPPSSSPIPPRETGALADMVRAPT